jgi:hypothetical protein
MRHRYVNINTKSVNIKSVDVRESE